MRKLTGLRVVPALLPFVMLAAAGLATTQAGCSSSSSPAAETPDAATADAATPVDDAAATPDVAAPVDAATCDRHLPAGFSSVVASASDTELGDEVSMALDENDDPMFAYLVFASGTGTLEFTRWDRCAGAFTAAVAVDTVGGVSNSRSAREVSLAYDPSTKEVAVAYQKIVADPGYNDAPVIWLASRKATDTAFATQQVSEGEKGDVYDAGTPSLAMSGGNLYLAYVQDNYDCGGSGGGCSGLWFLQSAAAPPADDDAGAVSADGGTPAHYFTRATIPYGGDVAQARTDSVSVAVDSAGTPAVAFYVAPQTGYNTSLVFWKKGTVEAALVTDSNDIQNDDVDVTLRFDGTKPRVAGHLVAEESANYDISYAESDDGGTWFVPVHVPRDGTAGTAFTSALAFDQMGHEAIAADTNTGDGDNVCGNPYLARSSDGMTWSACGADTTKARKWDVSALNAAYGSARLKGTLALGFQNSNTQGEQAGVVYWQGQ